MAKKSNALDSDRMRDLFGDEISEAQETDAEREARLYGKPFTYRLPEELGNAFRQIALDEGVGISELARYVLAQFVRRYHADRVNLPKKPRDEYDIDMDLSEFGF